MPNAIITGYLFNLVEHSPDSLANLKETMPKPFRWMQLASVICGH